MTKERSLFRAIVTNFWNSLKPRKVWGICVGKDYNGTEYYEIPLSESTARRRPSRWFVPTKEGDFEQDIPPEWEAWLRYRRQDPPTEDEIEKNLKRTMDILEKAEKLKQEHRGAEENDALSVTPKLFPMYKDLEETPGEQMTQRPRNKSIK